MNDGLIWLYGFVPQTAVLPEGGLAGVADGEIELAPLDGIAAVIGRIPDDVYQSESLEARLQDLPWVAEQGLRHEQVVAWFVDHATISPVRLFTIFSSLDALSDEIAPRARQIAERLERFASLREWDLKVAYDPERVIEHLGEISDEIAALDAQIERANPGKRYLLERKRKERARSAALQSARGAARDLLDSLRQRAEETRVVELPDNPEGLATVLSAALLLDRNVEEEVRREVERKSGGWDAIGLHVTFSGPWAPYRFSRQTDPEPDTTASVQSDEEARR